MRICVLLYNGADELDCIGPYGVFQHAARLRDDIEVSLVTLEPKRQVTAERGLRLLPDQVLEGVPDLVVVPGGGWLNDARRGLRTEIANGQLLRRIVHVHAAGATIAGISTGAMALSAAGLLDGRPATTHFAAVDELKATAARVVESGVVDAGDLLTCGGGISSLDLALWVLERQYGGEMADAVASSMGHPRSRDVYVMREREAPLLATLAGGSDMPIAMRAAPGATGMNPAELEPLAAKLQPFVGQGAKDLRVE